MHLKLVKWLGLMAASTMLYGNSNTEEIADCCPPPAPAKNCCPPKPCCKPVPVKPMPPCNICVEPDPCCPPMSVYNRNVNPPAACMGQCVNDIFITGAFLWWLPDEADFSLAFNQKTPFVANTATVPGSGDNGEVVRFGFQWDPGFRVGLGWQSHTSEGWDLYASWTWYKNKTTENESAIATTGGAGLVPYWGFSLGETADALFTSMSASWRLLYNMIDLELGRDFYVSCALSLRPFMSVEGGWIHRKFNASYAGLLNSVTGFDGTTESYGSKSNYWGVGPRAGLGGNWMLGMGFKLFGNLSGSLLSGRVTKNSASFTNASIVGSYPGNNSWSDGKVFRIVPHLQAIVGAGWDFCFSCEQYRFAFTAGWEVNEFWNVPMALFPDTNSALLGTGSTGISNRINRSHNVGLGGLNVEARFDF